MSGCLLAVEAQMADTWRLVGMRHDCEPTGQVKVVVYEFGVLDALEAVVYELVF